MTPPAGPRPLPSDVLAPRAMDRHERVLVVVAHPDDPEFLFGATIAMLVQHQSTVRYVICSNGANGSRDTEISLENLSEKRRSEQRAAAAVLGVASVDFLGFPDGELSPSRELRQAITREIRRNGPDLVLTHFPRRALRLPVEASHPDHCSVGEATLSAVFPDASNARAYPELLDEGFEPHRVPEIWIPGYEGADHVVDATPFMDQKVRAILCHESQLHGLPPGEAPPWLYPWMRAVGARAGYPYAEDYLRIT